MTLHFLPTPPKSVRLQILWRDYQDALHLFQQNWWDEDVTQRYVDALRRWMDAMTEKDGGEI